MNPLLAIVVTTYDRPKYLRQMLMSLNGQNYRHEYELVILDNGSSPAVDESVFAALCDPKPRVHLVREDVNALAWSRISAAAKRSTAEYILVPGDDDLLKPNYLGIMHELAASSPAPMLISAAAETIDESGRPLGGRLSPGQFPNQRVALASIISQATYAMPASGFHRSILDAVSAPRTRSSVDWWIWLQCWLRGPAAISTEVTVQYRVHSGQEQHQYGVDGKALDAARMLLDFVTSVEFRGEIRGWTDAQHSEFIHCVLDGRGPSWGEPRWSSVIQAVLADALAPFAPASEVAALFADASARAGVIAPPGALNALVQYAATQVLSSATWSHVPVRWEFESGCPAVAAWSTYLAASESHGREIQVNVICPCAGLPGREHRVSARVRVDETTSEIQLPELPSEPAAAELFDVLGREIGRPGGLGQPIGVEEQAVALIRRLRKSPAANRLVTLGRRMGLRIG